MYPAAPPPLFFVFNAASGRDDTARLLPLVQATLLAAGRDGDCFVARQPHELHAVVGRAVNAAREARGAVVAAGGDGTLSAVAQAVWNAHLVMGVLPQGHANFFARAHGVPLKPALALQALLTARIEPVPLGMVGDQVFLVGASMGLYPPAPPRRLRGAVLGAALGALLRGESSMTLELHHDGEARVLRTRTLHVGHNAAWLRALGLPGAAPVPEEGVDAITLPLQSMAHTLWTVLRGSAGRLDGAEGADHLVFDSLQVRPRRHQARMPLHIDGEPLWLPTPLVFRAAPHPLRLLVPARATATAPD